jgi:hypothetical protein
MILIYIDINLFGPGMQPLTGQDSGAGERGAIELPLRMHKSDFPRLASEANRSRPQSVYISTDYILQ